ncbi:4-hydroxybenzoate polyprenyltransferase [Isosphaera pallida ATCC 43644]|uniref:4-hydroxybenzoate polyprenyltransferase n=2 Tax=Isosphaera pallida TaxID=128 RepID=E8QYV6_ISOPI|nr:4-hydroxybenzoate octaprenyltransferase [Isosphaera pallida]ADV62093.1 4-hydroxybenzoate polyprenyltransferase [Isosphaera pallida ATCC 43644]
MSSPIFEPSNRLPSPPDHPVHASLSPVGSPSAADPPANLWQATRRALEMIKFSHTLFALPFALLGAALAAKGPDGWRGRPQDFVGILICMATARSAAMAFNRLVDRRYDAANPRTANRHLATGALSVNFARLFALTNTGLFIAATSLFLPNWLPLALSVPVLLWLLGYSYAKRFTSLAHYWLGLALGMAPLAAWIALRGDVAWTPVILSAVVLFWVGGFDIIYACQDVDFDRAVGLRSIPARLGVSRALWVARMSHALMLVCLLILGQAAGLGWIYHLGVAVVALVLLAEHLVVRSDDLARINLAFFQLNVVISVGLLMVGLLDLTFLG